MPQKRKASEVSANAQAGSSDETINRVRNDQLNENSHTSFHPNAQQAEDFGIVLREFYPPEMSNERCQAYNDGNLERPIETLQRVYREVQRQYHDITPKDAVLHWFKSDLRLQDNHALHMAYQMARKNRIPLICLYIFSPEDLTAHLCSPPQVDFILRTLRLLQEDLAQLDIPLYMETHEPRQTIPQRIVELCETWGVSNVFANIEYEVDELRREAKMIRLCADKGIQFKAVHDACVVTPGELRSQQGKQYAVYSPWFRAWLSYLKENPDTLELARAPGKNTDNARETIKGLFDSDLPEIPYNKALSTSEREHFKRLYPEGEGEARNRLSAFLAEKAKEYNTARNMVARQSTSVLSPYFAVGSLSARTAVAMAKDINKSRLDGINSGYSSWISEVAWRDFYKHVLVHWPFICMNKCFKFEFTNIEWEYDRDLFHAWCEGKTGFPIVDAAMRQLNTDAWMHNRARMIVSSFLTKDLMIDWRCGERYFMEHLIDGDFASNHGGWGFGSSTGVDPQPYFRIFNPLRQSERFDPDGEYIRRWVPELSSIEDHAIHDPYNRGAGSIARKNGYPEPIVDHSKSRNRALERFKKALER